MTDGTAGVSGGGPIGGAGGMLTEGVAELGAGASVSIAVVEPLPTTLAYEDATGVLRGLGCWQLGGTGAVTPLSLRLLEVPLLGPPDVALGVLLGRRGAARPL